MPKRRKSKSRKPSKRRKGLGGLAGNTGERIGCLLASVITANLADEGLAYLGGLDFMQVEPKEVKDEKTGELVLEERKFNFKQIGLHGAIMAGAGAGAVMLKNPYLNAVGTGLATAASLHLKNSLVKPALGLGDVDDFLKLYETEDNGNVRGVPDLAGGNSVDLAGDDVSSEVETELEIM